MSFGINSWETVNISYGLGYIYEEVYIKHNSAIELLIGFTLISKLQYITESNYCHSKGKKT